MVHLISTYQKPVLGKEKIVHGRKPLIALGVISDVGPKFSVRLEQCHSIDDFSKPGTIEKDQTMLIGEPVYGVK